MFPLIHNRGFTILAPTESEFLSLNLPPEAMGPYKKLFLLLVENYASLLRSHGSDMAFFVQ
jgi:hypothetical protein